MKIKEYCIVTSKAELPVLINALLGQGWQPYGYIFLDRTGLLKQAMVKYEEATKPTKEGSTKKSKKAGNDED